MQQSESPHEHREGILDKNNPLPVAIPNNEKQTSVPLHDFYFMIV